MLSAQFQTAGPGILISGNFGPDSLRCKHDEKLASQLIGKRILVGMTYLDNDGTLIKQDQFFGVVRSVSAVKGVELFLEGKNGGTVRWLPPDLRSTKIADRGEYTLRDTKEVVVDPDYIATWTVTKGDVPGSWDAAGRF